MHNILKQTKIFHPNYIRMSCFEKTDSCLSAGEVFVFPHDEINCNEIHSK